MSRLLGGQIGLDDFLFAHVKGDAKTVKVSKDGPALGLTISDNGAGYAFIKKIRDDSIMARVEGINVGDHIAAINGQDLKGCRHFEVARMLKDIEIGSEFTIASVSPKKAFDEIDQRGAKPTPTKEPTVAAGAGKKTLRMKRDGTAVVEEVNDKKTQDINKIDDMLDAQVGIRDEELSTTIYELALASKEIDELGDKIDSELAAFAFPDDFVMDVFELLH